MDEDYEGFGLSGEVAAVLAEKGLSVKYRRVCTRTTIPYARDLEDQALPNVDRICAAARELVRSQPGWSAIPIPSAVQRGPSTRSLVVADQVVDGSGSLIEC